MITILPTFSCDRRVMWSYLHCERPYSSQNKKEVLKMLVYAACHRQISNLFFFLVFYSYQEKVDVWLGRQYEQIQELVCTNNPFCCTARCLMTEFDSNPRLSAHFFNNRQHLRFDVSVLPHSTLFLFTVQCFC